MRPATVIVGAQWGDEGKGKIVDIQTEDGSVVARWCGGPNAGHNLDIGTADPLILHSIPSGITKPTSDLYIGSGCVVNPLQLIEEIERVVGAGFKVEGRLKISPDTPIISPAEILLDKLTGRAVGSTGNGIGPIAAMIALRTNGTHEVGLRFCDIMGDSRRHKYNLIGAYDAIWEDRRLSDLADNYGIERDDRIKHTIEELMDVIFEQFVNKGYIAKRSWMREQYQIGRKMVLEGAQSILLDPNGGNRPNVTSTRTRPQYALGGADLPPNIPMDIIGVIKLIVTKVGDGVFVGEFGGEEAAAYCAADDEQGRKGLKNNKEVEKQYDIDEDLFSEDPFRNARALRRIYKQYGGRTGPPRRVGPLDLFQLADVCKSNGISRLVLNMFDAGENFIRMSTWKHEIPVVTAYKLDKTILEEVPNDTATLVKVEPVITRFASWWEEDIEKLNATKDKRDLPKNGVTLIKAIEEATGTPVDWVGTGPGPNDLVYIEK